MNNFDLAQIDFETLKQINLLKVDRNTLIDIRDIHIDENLPEEERQKEFVRQIKNPYCFKVGKVIVKVTYANNGKSFEEVMKNYLQML